MEHVNQTAAKTAYEVYEINRIAQQRGFDDFYKDSDNPYPEGSTGNVLWQNGWNIAFMLMKRRIEA